MSSSLVSSSSSSSCSSIPVVRSLGSGAWNKDKALLLHSKNSTLDCGSTASTNSTTESEMDVYDLATGWSEEDMAAVVDYWTLSPKNQEALYELGYRLRDIQHPKNCAREVVHFLLAKYGKVDAAEDMFRDSIRWREKVGADTIADHPPPQELIDSIPGAVLKGADRDGDPIFLDRVVSCDTLGLLDKYGTDMMVHHAVWIREAVAQGAWLPEWEERKGKPVRQATIISDMEGLSRRHLHRRVIKLFGEIMRLDQDNYPEGAKRIILIRAPVIFRLVFSLVRPFFDPGVAAKMIFCGKDNYREVLSKYMDLKVLPPVVVEEGEGEALEGMPPNWNGGLLSPTFGDDTTFL